MTVKEIKTSELREYENNPRNNEAAVEKVAASIEAFGFKVPIVIDKENVIIAGHTRLKAAKHLGIEKVPCIVADDLNPEQVKAFRVADNKTAEFAEWDFDLLQQELEELAEMGFEMDQFGFDEIEASTDEIENFVEKGSLEKRFLIPPFSVWDTRQGYWQERKRQWKSLGIKSELGRETNLMKCSDLPTYARYGGNLKGVSVQTSVFDPVICEICFKWFNIDNGKIFDCFAGGSVRGIVAETLGYSYTGIDLRQEQIDANIENAKEIGVNPNWICDDSLNVDNYLEDESVDLIFSCPPYADLEVYSDDPHDISNMEYPDFIKTYREIIKRSLKKLKNDRFAIFVVGDVRDKNGFYYDFISDTKKAFIDCGCSLYNDVVLVEAVGTAAMRAGKLFKASRKLVKTHQNILIFYKGNPDNIKDNYKEIEIEKIIEENIDEDIEE